MGPPVSALAAHPPSSCKVARISSLEAIKPCCPPVRVAAMPQLTSRLLTAPSEALTFTCLPHCHPLCQLPLSVCVLITQLSWLPPAPGLPKSSPVLMS